MKLKSLFPKQLMKNNKMKNYSVRRMDYIYNPIVGCKVKFDIVKNKIVGGQATIRNELAFKKDGSPITYDREISYYKFRDMCFDDSESITNAYGIKTGIYAWFKENKLVVSDRNDDRKKVIGIGLSNCASLTEIYNAFDEAKSKLENIQIFDEISMFNGPYYEVTLND